MSGAPEGIELVLATANPDKAREIHQILGPVGVRLLPRPAAVPEVVEDGATLADNAALKAEALCAATGRPSVADDTGLEVDALGGAPGVLSARFAGPRATYADNVAALLQALAGSPDPAQRRARFRTVALVAFPGGRRVLAEGAVEGSIALEPRGTAGFGYDPLFVPDNGDGRTFGEMSAEEKAVLSHRGRAFRALAEALAAGPSD